MNDPQIARWPADSTNNPMSLLVPLDGVVLKENTPPADWSLTT